MNESIDLEPVIEAFDILTESIIECGKAVCQFWEAAFGNIDIESILRGAYVPNNRLKMAGLPMRRRHRKSNV